MANKKVLYTCITGNYDKFSVISTKQDQSWDFVCFTDSAFKPHNWIIKPIPSSLKCLTLVKQQRIIKICPHKFLGEYDLSIWCDGNLDILGDIEDFISTFDINSKFIWARNHPVRTCIYKEKDTILRAKKDISKIINNQVSIYREKQFPENYGLHETNIIIRKHNNINVQIFDNLWASEVLNHSHRDQLSFDYIRWLTGIDVGTIPITDFSQNSFFRKREHGK